MQFPLGNDLGGAKKPRRQNCMTGILRKSLGFGVFAKIFSKNIVIPSKEIPFFGEAHQRFWAIIAKLGFFGVFQMAESPNSVIW
jgi:hypothetical protein